MAGVAEGKLARALRGAERVALDTSALIYHLEDVRPYSELTSYLLSKVESGDVELIISVIALAEVLAGAWRSGDRRRAVNLETALRGIPGVIFAGVDVDIATKAAEVRGRTKMPLPDALVITSSVAQGARVVVTNDGGWRGKSVPCRVLILDDLI